MANPHIRIFPLDHNPRAAAQAHDDSRLMIAIWEVAHILSKALYKTGTWKSNLFVPDGNMKDPWIDWCLLSTNNFIWMYRYGKALSDEYLHRELAKEHSAMYALETTWKVFQEKKKEIISSNNVSMTIFPNFTGFDDLPPTIAYRKYLCEKVWNEATLWKRRDKPSWHYLPKCNFKEAVEAKQPSEKYISNGVEQTLASASEHQSSFQAERSPQDVANDSEHFEMDMEKAFGHIGYQYDNYGSIH